MKTSIDAAIIENTPVLKNLASKFTSDPIEKDDLVQETFVRSLRSLENFINNPRLVAWLYVIMKNIYLNRYQRKAIIRIAEKEMTRQEAMRGKTTNYAESKFIIEDIQRTLKTLSDENYAVISMYLEGYKYHEIATYLKLKEGTVKTRIHTIRKTLRKKLRVYRV